MCVYCTCVRACVCVCVGAHLEREEDARETPLVDGTEDLDGEVDDGQVGALDVLPILPNT